MMSDMGAKPRSSEPVTFTVRDMNRNTQAVLEACRVHGQVTIRSRSGESFRIETVKPDSTSASPAPAFAERLRRHREKVRALGFAGPSKGNLSRFHRIVAGEE